MAANGSDPRGWYARTALLPDGWATGVEIELGSDGLIESVRTDVDDSDLEPTDGPIVPGMANVHSHAFQRVLVGRTQILHGADDFWSWRTLMYKVVSVLEPEQVQAVSAWAFADMLAHGYTSVGEFHYLHRDADGNAYADPSELSHRIVAAATDAGIQLTLLPVLYRRAGFDDAPLQGPARRFGLDLNEFVRLVEELDRLSTSSGFRVGVAPHSLRAVGPNDLGDLRDWVRKGPERPIHMHAAEQPKEVAECLGATGFRPVEWLLNNAAPDSAWTLIHATHMSDEELDGLVASGATVGLCPTTEADLGDGRFRLEEWLEAGGAFGIGSDSNVSVSPAEELRLLAYAARLATGRRGALPLDTDRPAAAQLWQTAASTGARSLGMESGGLVEGGRADFIVLDDTRPSAVGLDPDQLLDAFVMSGDRSCISRTIVGGRIVARNGRHADADALESRARDALRAVTGRLG